MNWLRRLFSRRSVEFQHKLAEELTHWSLVQVFNETTGQAAVIRIRMDRSTLDGIASYTTAIEIKWPYESPNQMPPPEVNARQVEFDRALDELSGENGYSELVQVSTGMCVKEWLYYTSDRERFMAAFNRLLVGHKPYPIQIAFYDDPFWRLWQATVDSIHEKGA